MDECPYLMLGEECVGLAEPTMKFDHFKLNDIFTLLSNSKRRPGTLVLLGLVYALCAISRGK